MVNGNYAHYQSLTGHKAGKRSILHITTQEQQFLGAQIFKELRITVSHHTRLNIFRFPSIRTLPAPINNFLSSSFDVTSTCSHPFTTYHYRRNQNSGTPFFVRRTPISTYTGPLPSTSVNYRATSTRNASYFNT